MNNQKTLLPLLLTVLLLKAGLIIFVILNAGIELGPDEAQYWTWSQTLAFGYYSKPPFIAWQIWLGTALFGNTELGVRFGSIVIGTLLPLAVYALGRSARISYQASFFAAIMMAFSPLGMMASFLAITDGGMVLCWTLAAILLVRAIVQKERCPFYALGFCIAFGALFKWLMYEFWIVVLICLSLIPLLRSRHFIGGVLVSLLGLIPSVIWNIHHDWATFRHVGATIWVKDTADVGTTALMQGNFLDFLGAQAVLVSPILFLVLLVSFWGLWRNRSHAPIGVIFCGSLSFGLLALYFLIACFKKMQGNWVDFAYPTAMVAIAWYAWDVRQVLRGWLVGGVCLSVALSLIAFAIPSLQQFNLVPIPYKMSPFKHNVGWKTLGKELSLLGYNSSEHFLFSDKYQTTSVLSFYAEAQKRAYFFNIQDLRKNQFSYWPSMKEEQRGKTGFFVAVENMSITDPRWKSLRSEYEEKLLPYFENVQFLGVYPLFYANGSAVKGALIFKAIGYNGKEPLASYHY